jgi:hypothetical protein
MIELLEGVLTRFRGLHSIRLDSSFLIGPTEKVSASQGQWHPLWIRASQVFFLVVTAMAQSGVSVRKFNAYRQTPDAVLHLMISPNMLQTSTKSS